MKMRAAYHTERIKRPEFFIGNFFVCPLFILKQNVVSLMTKLLDHESFRSDENIPSDIVGALLRHSGKISR